MSAGGDEQKTDRDEIWNSIDEGGQQAMKNLFAEAAKCANMDEAKEMLESEDQMKKAIWEDMRASCQSLVPKMWDIYDADQSGSLDEEEAVKIIDDCMASTMKNLPKTMENLITGMFNIMIQAAKEQFKDMPDDEKATAEALMDSMMVPMKEMAKAEIPTQVEKLTKDMEAFQADAERKAELSAKWLKSLDSNKNGKVEKDEFCTGFFAEGSSLFDLIDQAQKDSE